MADHPLPDHRVDDDDTAVRPSPGASGPGEVGYDGDVAVGDEGAAAGAEAYQDPFGRPDGGVKP
jgi:hypothetical protein